MTASAKKNVMLISLDDMVAYWKYKTLFGQELQTPNLDRICAQSTAFHSAYCQVPVCSPSRASFMSGISPYHSGIVERDPHYYNHFPPQKMWPHALKSNGVYSSTGGKVMRGYRALPEWVHDIVHSDERTLYHIAKRRRQYDERMLPGHIEYGGFRGGLATNVQWAEDNLYCNRVADRAIAFLNDYDGEAPFYRGVGFQSPHGPWTTPRRFKEMYPVFKFEQPAEWAGDFPEPPLAGEISHKNIDPKKTHFWKKSLRNYFSSISYADYQIGRVWDALKASRFADSTMVVILSDHGLHVGERERFTKGSLWEQVTNVPLIIHDPQAPQGRVVTDPVGLIDVGNTIMDYLDLPPIEGSVGHSLRPQMAGASVPDRAVPTFHFRNSAIRKGKYRYIRYADGTEELFDVEADWWQTTNLGPDHPAHEEMRQAHVETCAEYGLNLN